jgi:hypothetical protein
MNRLFLPVPSTDSGTLEKIRMKFIKTEPNRTSEYKRVDLYPIRNSVYLPEYLFINQIDNVTHNTNQKSYLGPLSRPQFKTDISWHLSRILQQSDIIAMVQTIEHNPTLIVLFSRRIRCRIFYEV